MLLLFELMPVYGSSDTKILHITAIKQYTKTDYTKMSI